MTGHKTIKKPEDQEQPRVKGLDETTCYRLLDHNDTIRPDDEFLEDDAQTWTPIWIEHRWNVGSYWHTALKPMRRILSDNKKDLARRALDSE